MSVHVVQLGEVVEISKGKKAPRLFRYQTGNTRRYLQIDDLRPGANPKFVEPFDCPESSKSDVVIAWDGANAGTVSYNLEGYIGSTLAILRLTNGKVLAPYLARFLESNFRFLQTQSTGATVPHLNREVLERLEIPLPDLTEQKRIAGLLEQADRLRRTRCYALELSDTFLPAAFLELFGSLSFQRVPFEELALPKRGSFVNGPFGSNLLTSELVDEGVPVIYIRDIADGRYERVSTVCVTPAKAEELSICSVMPGDLLIAKVGDPPGKAAVYPQGFPSGVITQDVIRLRPNPKLVLSEYLHGFLNSNVGYRLLKPIIVEGTRERFGLTPFKELAVPIPPLTKQKRYASLVAQHERLRIRQREELRQADHLFQSLLHRVFRGELVTAKSAEVRVPFETRIRPGTTSNSTRHLARAVLSAEIVHRLHTEPTFGRIKHQKIFHLCEHIAQLQEVQGQYHREAAGPLDNKLIYANVAELKRQKWYEEFSRKQFGHAYRRLSKAGGHRRHLERYWGEKVSTIERLIELMRTWDTERCEIFSTIYAAWNDLIIWNREPTTEAILHEVLESWHGDKKRIAEERWRKAIGWMRKEGFVPTGFGKPTR